MSNARLGNAAGGAASGAAAGSVLGPWGTAGGAVIGGLSGWLSGGGPSDAELAAQRAQEAERANAVSLARGAAMGTAPSAAQNLLNMNTDRSNMLAISQAKSMAGANPALAATLASNQAAANSQQNIQAAAALRAQEMENARAQYLAATGANVAQAQTQDAAVTQQNNLKGAYNEKLFNGFMGGAAAAGGRFAGSQSGNTWGAQ
jgi:hypothetical protein